jgi:hypothetical protein
MERLRAQRQQEHCDAETHKEKVALLHNAFSESTSF